MILINRIINADLKLRHAWKKNTEALLMVVEIWSLGILDRKARVDLLPYRKIKVFGNKIQHFEQDIICLKLIPFFWGGGLLCFINNYYIFSCCYDCYDNYNFCYNLDYWPHFYFKLVNVYLIMFMLKIYNCNKVVLKF